MSDFGGLGIFFVIALVFPVMALIPAFILQPRQPTREKGIPYECGVDTEGKTYVQFRAGYFMYALVFIVFDIETVFLYPWAVRFGELGLFALIEMFIFVGILAVGLWYAWQKGALSWK
ncbi:MAG: NADH-quinone oxidoreductase subunit A [Selenomonadaceae bacterium]